MLAALWWFGFYCWLNGLVASLHAIVFVFVCFGLFLDCCVCFVSRLVLAFVVDCDYDFVLFFVVLTWV